MHNWWYISMTIFCFASHDEMFPMHDFKPILHKQPFFFGAPERKTPFPLRRRSEEIEDFRRIVECSGGYRGDKTKLVDHVWVNFRWNHDWNITIIVVLEAFYMFTKLKKRFRSIFHLYENKNKFVKHFASLQSQKTCFRNVFHCYK